MQESANNNVASTGYLEIISFHLGKQVFCVNIMSVRESAAGRRRPPCRTRRRTCLA